MSRFLGIAAVALIASGCVRNETIEPTAAPVGPFSRDVAPIFKAHCGGASCHGGGQNGFAAGFDLTSYDAIFRGSIYGTAIVSGSAFMSPLVQTINQLDTTISPISSVPMPVARPTLSRTDIETVARWIDAGARNDDGVLPFPEPRPLGKVYFTSQAVDLVGVLDLQTNAIMRYVTVGNALPFSAPPQAPHNVQIDDQGRYYYVTLIVANKLKKFDALTNTFLGEAAVGTSPAHVVITQDGSKAYVTNFDQTVGRVYAVRTADMAVTRIITSPPLMRATHAARLSHDGQYLYVGSNGSDLLHVIQTSNDSVIATIPVAPGVPPIGSFVHKPYQVAVRNDDQYVYCTLNGSGMVSVIRRTGSTFQLDTVLQVGVNPLQCEVTSDGRFLYVCNRGSGSVSVINAQTNRVQTTIPFVGQQPHGIDITDNGQIVYVTCENVQAAVPPHHPTMGSKDPGYIAVISVATNQVIRRIEVGGFAAGISITPGKGN